MPCAGYSSFSTTRNRNNKFGMPGQHVKVMKEALLTLKKIDKKMVFQFPVPPNFRGHRGVYSDVIQNPLDLGTVMRNIDEKYRYLCSSSLINSEVVPDDYGRWWVSLGRFSMENFASLFFH